VLGARLSSGGYIENGLRTRYRIGQDEPAIKGTGQTMTTTAEAKMKHVATRPTPTTPPPAVAPANKASDNEFLMYSGNSLGKQLHDFKNTPSLFTVVLDHLVPSRKHTTAAE
jgi:hypothetical protein